MFLYFYNHARRLRLKKLLYLEVGLSRSSNGFFKPLLGPGGGFAPETETATRRFKIKTAVTWPFRK